jgi:hypothetical protein
LKESYIGIKAGDVDGFEGWVKMCYSDQYVTFLENKHLYYFCYHHNIFVVIEFSSSIQMLGIV